MRYPRHIIRAQQRSRTALPSFREALNPLFHQTGVDRVQILLRGSWRVTDMAHDATSAADYKRLLASIQTDLDWFCLPESNRTDVRLKTRAQNTSTLSEVYVSVKGWPANGTVLCKVVANPTRTLAHLIAEYGDVPDFLPSIEALPVSSFFARSRTPIAPSFASPDNWIADADRAEACLGADVFSAFLPIFVRQMFNLIVGLVSPRDSTPVTSDGTDIVMAEPGIEVRLDCGRIRVPQIECYFERHHSEAVAGVRAAVAAALVTLDHAKVARYDQYVSDWMEREDDCLSIATNLPNDRSLLIYAKSRRRIRFEVKRLKTGDYGGLPAPVGPDDKLLTILENERTNLLTACRWARVGALFVEPDQPAIGDLTRLCSLVATACFATGEDVEPVMARLFEDGGVGRSELSEALVKRLCDMGVLDRTSLRRKDRPLPTQRLALQPEYRAVIDSVAHALVTSDD